MTATPSLWRGIAYTKSLLDIMANVEPSDRSLIHSIPQVFMFPPELDGICERTVPCLKISGRIGLEVVLKNDLPFATADLQLPE
jgi:hypothetical protein